MVPAVAVLEFGVKRAVGVELSHTRVEISCEGLKVINGYLTRSIEGVKARSLVMSEGSMLDVKMDDATVVFMCATVTPSPMTSFAAA